MAEPRKEVLSDGVEITVGRKRRSPRPSMLRQGFTTIYALFDPDTLEDRYVGKTNYLNQRRLTYHVSAAHGSKSRSKDLPSALWIRELADRGKKPSIRTLEIVAHGIRWKDREKFWIAELRRIGRNLLNVTSGGQGGGGYSRSDETRRKNSLANRRGLFFECQICASRFWRKPNEIAKGDCKFCSRGCYATSQRKRAA